MRCEAGDEDGRPHIVVVESVVLSSSRKMMNGEKDSQHTMSDRRED